MVLRRISITLMIAALLALGAGLRAGEGIANKRSRVVIVHDAGAMVTFSADAAKVESMVERGLTNLTAQPTLSGAWRSLVSTNDRVGIKVFSTPGGTSGTRPAVVSAVVKGLLQAGLPATNIIIWDRRIADLHLAGYADLARTLGVRIAGSAEEGYDDQPFYENALLGKLIWGDHEFGQKPENTGRKSFVSKLVTRQMTKIIHITPLLSHNSAGVSGNLYGLTMDSVDNTIRFEADPNVFSSALPEIYALPILGDRVVLNIVDALICQYEGEQRGLLHYSTVLDELRFSTDPVALDMLSIRDIASFRKDAGTKIPKATLEIYTNATLLEIGQSDFRKIIIDRVP